MAEYEQANGDEERVQDLAERIAFAQGKEIREMQQAQLQLSAVR